MVWCMEDPGASPARFPEISCQEAHYFGRVLVCLKKVRQTIYIISVNSHTHYLLCLPFVYYLMELLVGLVLVYE